MDPLSDPLMNPNKRNFVEGVDLVFRRWTAFGLAVSMGLGGHNTEQMGIDFRAALVQYFEQEGRRLEPEDVEDILLETMCNEFGTVLEDASEVQVARSLCQLYAESIRGETGLLELLRRQNVADTSLSVLAEAQEVSSADDDDDNNDDDDDTLDGSERTPGPGWPL